MPSWSEIFKEIREYQEISYNIYDIVRGKYLKEIANYTKRNVILYASSWTQKYHPELVSITDEDVQGFMEVIHGLDIKKHLDIILHSPGGSPGAAESLVLYLRSKFKHIRVIIPHGAMSAATMIACAADEIIMGKHSYLGPVDPQIILETERGYRAVPAYAIIEQFNKAKEECRKDISNLPAWLPTLSQYHPGLLAECQNAIDLSKELVEKWLGAYMLKGNTKKAKEIAKKLSDHKYFKSHDRRINYEEAKKLGLKVSMLEDDQKLQDIVLSLFHATTITFDNTLVVKVIENHDERRFIKIYPEQNE